MERERDIKEMYRTFFEAAWHGDSPDEGIDALFAEDFVDHTPSPGQLSGRDGNKWWVRTIRAAFPDLRGRIENLISDPDGEYVGFVLVFECTHTNEFMGIPGTGKRVVIQGVDIVKAGQPDKFTDGWATFDIMSLMAQIGAIAAPAKDRPADPGPPS
jgi:predicted ester cyclase